MPAPIFKSQCRNELKGYNFPLKKMVGRLFLQSLGWCVPNAIDAPPLARAVDAGLIPWKTLVSDLIVFPPEREKQLPQDFIIKEVKLIFLVVAVAKAGLQPRASHMLSKHSSTDLSPSPNDALDAMVKIINQKDKREGKRWAAHPEVPAQWAFFTSGVLSGLWLCKGNAK